MSTVKRTRSAPSTRAGSNLRNTTRYTLENTSGSKTVYVGKTRRPKARLGEHKRDGTIGKSGVMRKHGPKVTDRAARKWETKKIAALRRRNGARSLKNRTK